MRAIQFCKVDLIRCKSQLKFLLVFSILALWLGLVTDAGVMFSFVYMIFAGIILSGQPFMIEQTSESGFLNMLPGSKKERVAGRYLMSLSFLLFGAIVGALIVVIINVLQKTTTEGLEIMIPLALGVGMLCIALQNILLYAIGKGKSQQMIGIIRMIPGFVVFFAGLGIAEEIMENPAQYTNLWIFSHLQESALLVLLVGILFYIAAIVISTAIIKKKDFN